MLQSQYNMLLSQIQMPIQSMQNIIIHHIRLHRSPGIHIDNPLKSHKNKIKKMTLFMRNRII